MRAGDSYDVRYAPELSSDEGTRKTLVFMKA